MTMKSILRAPVISLVLLGGAIGCFSISSGYAAEGSEKTVIHIGTLPGLRYDTTEFSVRPGADVELVFSNSDEMLHNLVVTAPGARLEIVNASLLLGASGQERDFVPDSPKVLWATKLVQPGESFTLPFTAPEIPGDYPYVCTFPGHGLVMFGNMRVTNDPRPPVKNSEVPAMAAAMENHDVDHSDRAIVRRVFMPDAGPATIAVSLPGDYSYCWDAGAVRFRYAWKGGYVQDVYRRPERIIGDVFYREENGFPLRIGADPGSIPKRIQFRGYGLDVMGVPEFEYDVNGIEVRERIEARSGSLVRRFRTNAGNQTIWFPVSPEDETRVNATGVKEGNYFKFEGRNAKEFYITVNARGGVATN